MLDNHAVLGSAYLLCCVCILQDSVQSGRVEVQGLRVETRFIAGE